MEYKLKIIEWRRLVAILIVILIFSSFLGFGIENSSSSYNRRNIPLSTYDISENQFISLDFDSDLLNYFIINSFYKKSSKFKYKHISFIIKKSESLYFQKYSIISISDVSPPIKIC